MQRVDERASGSTSENRDEQRQADRDCLSPELQSSLLDQLNNAVIATGPDGSITQWNRHAEHLYQWTRDEVLGKSIFEVNTPTSSRDEARRILESVAAAGRWEGEF